MHTELQERELVMLRRHPHGAHRRPGVAKPAASLTAEVGLVVFKVAYEQWLNDPNTQPFARASEKVLASSKPWPSTCDGAAARHFKALAM
ncbi:hypothetical protein [Streptomyces sp. enrichment culture]|uniref:hypothetical protein n=1 Tax=Streptomyces sp. enrichment culture TaxID=1795815 RepID=UPI003F57D2F8